MKSVIFISFVLINSSVYSENHTTYELELVQTLFRHRDRIPDKVEVYKTDPYDLEYYAATGYGQLTNAEMQREYQIGQLLLKLYGNFLGEYKSNKVYANSTHFDRTNAFLQLVLAGLFPPPINSSWNERLNWTSIPIHYQSMNSDFLANSIAGSCGGLEMLQEMLENVPEVQERMAKRKEFLNYVQNKTEIKDTRIFTVSFLISNVLTIRSMSLSLPPWCSEQDFEKLTDIIAFVYKSLSITSALRKQIAGPIVKQFLENMKNHKKDDERKIYLYCGHDLNIAPYNGAHNFTGIPPIPEFESTVIIEKLRGSDDESYVRMFLWTGVSEQFIYLSVFKLKLENCDYECPLSIYEKIGEPVLPDPKLVQSISRNLHCDRGSPNKAINLTSENITRLTVAILLLLTTVN